MDHDDVCKFKKEEKKIEQKSPQEEKQDPYSLVVAITGEMYPR
jgi:hypothetical protein